MGGSFFPLNQFIVVYGLNSRKLINHRRRKKQQTSIKCFEGREVESRNVDRDRSCVITNYFGHSSFSIELCGVESFAPRYNSSVIIYEVLTEEFRARFLIGR